MTENDIHDAIETFARYGVPRDRIFEEVMRARYLDYVLFLDPTNVQYGISISDLYENMKRTAEKLGLYEGDEDTYAKVYTLALRVEPLVFAPAVPYAAKEIHSLLLSALEKAAASGATVLFTGAEGYLPFAAEIFDKLGGKRVAIAVKNQVWKERLQLLFPRGRAMLEAELDADTEKYDYIFDFETGNMSHVSALRGLLSETGAMDVVLPYGLLQEQTDEAEEARQALAKKKKLSFFYDTEIEGAEYAFLRFDGKEVETLTFGEAGFEGGAFVGRDQLTIPSDAFVEAADWNYDLYAYNGSQALQMLLSGNVISMEHAIADGFTAVETEPLPEGRYEVVTREAVTPSGIRRDLVSAEKLAAASALVLREGDLVISTYKDEIHTAVIPAGMNAIAGEGVLTLRPKAAYTAGYLKLYLDGQVGQLFLDTMKTGDIYHLTISRLLRIPMPKASKEAIDMADRLCRETTAALAAAEAAWRKAKRDGVALMMTH